MKSVAKYFVLRCFGVKSFSDDFLSQMHKMKLNYCVHDWFDMWNDVYDLDVLKYIYSRDSNLLATEIIVFMAKDHTNQF